jgi:hypothetical protein
MRFGNNDPEIPFSPIPSITQFVTSPSYICSMMVKDDEPKELPLPQYWDERYASAKKENEDGIAAIASFEWFRTFENLQPFFEKHLPPASSGCYILHLGCGNSLSPDFLFAVRFSNHHFPFPFIAK